MTLTRLPKHLIIASAIVATLLAASFVGALVWLAAAERSMLFAMPWVEPRLKQALPGMEYQVEDIRLHWPAGSRALTLRFDRLRLAGAERKFSLVLPEVEAEVDLFSLMGGRLAARRVALPGPSVQVIRQEDGSFALGEEDGNAPGSLHQLLAAWAEGGDARVESIEIRHAHLMMKDKRTGLVWDAPGTQIFLRKEQDHTVSGTLSANVTRAAAGTSGTPQEAPEPAMELLGRFSVKPSQRLLQASLQFSNTNARALSGLDPVLEPLAALNLPLQGAVDVDFEMESGRLAAKISLRGEGGTLEMPEQFPETLPLDRLEINLSLADQGTSLLVEGVTIESAGTAITARGLLTLNGDKTWKFEGDGGVESLPVERLANYWPKALAPLTREWVITHITAGTVPKAAAHIILTDADVAKEMLPPEAILATIEVQDAKVSYHPGLPPVEKVNGAVRFDKDGMTVDVASGRMGEAVVSKGRLTLADLYAETQVMAVALDITSPVKEAAAYLSKPVFATLKALQFSPEGAAGSVEGTVVLGVPLEEENLDKMTYDVKVTTKTGALQGFLGDLDIADANAAIALTTSDLSVTGTMALHGVPTDLTLKRHVDAAGREEMTYTVIMKAQAEDFSQFGVTVPSLLRGPVGLKATMRHAGGRRRMNAEADITDATIELSSFSYTKKPGNKGALTFTSESAEGSDTVEVTEFSVKAEGLEAKGKLTFNDKTDNIERMLVEKARFGANDFSFALSQTELPDGKPLLKAVLTGGSMDVRGMYQSDELFTSGLKLPHMQVMANVGRLVLGEGRELRNFDGKAVCTAEKCLSSEVTADFTTGEKLTYRLGIENGVRGLRIQTANAGELFRLLDVSDNISGGEFDLSAAFEDDKPARPLKGLMIVNNFKTLRAPVLAKLLNVASLTGVQELLTGEGIAFDKMSMPFTLEEGILTVENGKSVGNSLGLTAEGQINTASKQMNLKGTLVPSYTLNSVFSDIPILGALTGEGLFAANYSVTGNYTDPEVSVNPLSMLAPGFLRDLLGSSETPTVEKTPAVSDEDMVPTEGEGKSKFEDKSQEAPKE